MKELLILNPVCRELIWGTETWTVSAHPTADCTVAEGTYKGLTLSQLWDSHRELFHTDGDHFPLLIKVIDAKADLSVQVHPDNAYAREHENGSYGKAECWYIMESHNEDPLILGHRAKSRAEAQEMIRDGRWKDFLKTVRIKPGDLIQINPGTIHSIHGGTKLTEIQQSSDITYRLYDYDRKVNGKARELHIDKSLDVINIPDKSEENIFHDFPAGGHITEYYQVQRYLIKEEQTFCREDSFLIVSVVNGNGAIDGKPVGRGDSLIVPYGYGSVRITGEIEILITSL